MNGDLQRLIDRVQATSAQRWLLGALAVIAAVAAAVATDLAAASDMPWLTGVTAIVALVAAVSAGSHAGSVVVGLTFARWAVGVDDVATPWALLAALCLLVFHAALALMGATPHTATVDRVVLVRWAARVGGVAAATAGMWGLVAVLDRWRLPGGTLLALAAFLAATAGIVATLVASHPQRDDARRRA